MTNSPPKNDTLENEEKRKYSLANLTDFFDRHQSILRVAITATALAGVITIGRSIRVATKFHHARDIPKEFVRKHIQLRGQVQRVQDDVISVDHLPIFSLSTWHERLISKESNGHLRLVLAGVSVEAEGRKFMKNELTEGTTIWFRLLSVDNEQVETVVKLRKSALWSTNLNIRILRLGLGKTRALSAPPSKYTQRLTQKLLRAEMYSEKKKFGLWKPPSLRERLYDAVAARTAGTGKLVRSWGRHASQVPYQMWNSVRSFFQRK